MVWNLIRKEQKKIAKKYYLLDYYEQFYAFQILCVLTSLSSPVVQDTLALNEVQRNL